MSELSTCFQKSHWIGNYLKNFFCWDLKFKDGEGEARRARRGSSHEKYPIYAPLDVSCKISVKTAVRNVYGPFYEQFSFVRQNSPGDGPEDLKRKFGLNISFRDLVLEHSVKSKFPRIIFKVFYLIPYHMDRFYDIEKNSIRIERKV